MAIHLSKNTFMVERTVFCNTFPELKGEHLRVYLLMCRVVGVNSNGTFFMSLDTTARELNISIHKIRDSIDWLCKNYFIKKVGRRSQVNVYKVLVTPDYHRSTKTYYSNEHIHRDRVTMKQTQNGYCEIPIEMMEGSVLRDKTKWTDRKIKVLGQLYLYHWIDEYGGVDPNAAHFINNTINVSDLITYNLGCHVNDIKKVVRWLHREGYIMKVKAVYRINQNSCYKELQFIGDAIKTKQQPGDVIIDVIRLTCIPDLKLKNALKRTGGNIAV
ncbi:hypothetical protein SAMN04488072_1047 [Lentibacillus halodurans]|uniref:Helix-turn-helix domain-containing protein n=1 Tax=Lentibacillus halodurans TaxID=237679 RepID=A0A1I0WYD3_9BACI|nr:hypothetical protein [Lentibacillus halodurans]SFA93651.1 hypothetical protein SAMN04488072_1047 [Lentibacillus halodurans]